MSSLSLMSVIPVPFPCSQTYATSPPPPGFYLLVPSCIPAGLLGFRQNTSCPQVGEMEKPYVQGCFRSNDDSQNGGDTCIPSPHCLRSRTCHIICICFCIASATATATATASVSPPAPVCPSHNVLRHFPSIRDQKKQTPFFPAQQTQRRTKAKTKANKTLKATTKTGKNSQRTPPRERERIVSHLSILVENIQPASARPRVRLEKELHRGMRARAYHGVYLWAIRISSEQPCLIVHQGGLARTIRRRSCERNRCVVGVLVPPSPQSLLHPNDNVATSLGAGKQPSGPLVTRLTPPRTVLVPLATTALLLGRVLLTSLGRVWVGGITLAPTLRHVSFAGFGVLALGVVFLP